MAGCDPKVLALGEKVIDKWFKKGGIISQNLGKDSYGYLKQLWWSTTRKDFDYGDTPSLSELKSINKRIDIPFADENDEKELLEFMWDGIEAGFKEGIK